MEARCWNHAGAERSNCPVHWPLQADVHIFENWKVLHEYIASVKACTSESDLSTSLGSSQSGVFMLPGWRSMHFPLQACYLVRTSMGLMMLSILSPVRSAAISFRTKETVRHYWVLYPAALMDLSLRTTEQQRHTPQRLVWTPFLCFSATCHWLLIRPGRWLKAGLLHTRTRLGMIEGCHNRINSVLWSSSLIYFV